MTAARRTSNPGAVSWAYVPPEGDQGLLIPDAVISRALQAALDHGGEGVRVVDVVLVAKETLASMHGQFLGDPSETDVITFDLRGEDDPLVAGPEEGPEELGAADGASHGAPDGTPMEAAEADGELYISVDRAIEASEERGVSFERELVLYAVHGALHLCGFDDHEPDERQAMRAAERTVMGRLGYPEDLSPHDA